MWKQTLAEIEASTGRLLATVTAMTDEDVREPSLLPGWTRAHLLTHVARNADGLRNLLIWARTGVETPQYVSIERRNADIEAGAVGTAAQIADYVRDSAAAFAAEAGSLTGEARTAMVRAFGGWAHPCWYTLPRRWREVEAHHVDLGAGFAYTNWPESYVRWDLAETIAALRDFPVGTIRTGDKSWRLGAGPEVAGDPHEILAWLGGRIPGTSLTVTPPGELPSPPSWPVKPPQDWPVSVPDSLRS